MRGATTDQHGSVAILPLHLSTPIVALWDELGGRIVHGIATLMHEGNDEGVLLLVEDGKHLLERLEWHIKESDLEGSFLVDMLYEWLWGVRKGDYCDYAMECFRLMDDGEIGEALSFFHRTAGVGLTLRQILQGLGGGCEEERDRERLLRTVQAGVLLRDIQRCDPEFALARSGIAALVLREHTLERAVGTPYDEVWDFLVGVHDRLRGVVRVRSGPWWRYAEHTSL